MAIPQTFIDQLREKISLGELVAEIVQLKRAGKNLSGLCPFHHEKTPSFFVNDEDGFFNCFGCGKKGSAFDFVMESRGLSFPEAVRFLARRAGMEVPENERHGENEAQRRKKAMLRDVLRLASDHYHRVLLESPLASQARAYLEHRNVPKTLIEKFRIGFAPESETLLNAIAPAFGQIYPDLFQKQPPDRTAILPILASAGVFNLRTYPRVNASGDGAGESTRTSAYETFRGRILFPIGRSDGTCIGFGGRILVDHPQRPKYLNSSESLLYQKSQTLFGLHQALESIRRERELYLVEGYMDVIAFHASGIANAVATCGTSITPEHVKVMKRFVDRVVVVFDGDSAGLRAAAASFPVFLNSGIEVFGVKLPPGEDPGSLYESGRAEDLAEFITASRQQIVEFFIDHRMASASQSALDAGDLGQAVVSPVQIGRVAKDIAKILVKVENPVESEFLRKVVAEKLNVTPEAFNRLVAQSNPAPRDVGSIGEISVELKDEQGFDQGYLEAITRSSPNAATPHGDKAEASRLNKADQVLETLGQFWFQMLVAAVTDHRIARSLLEMPSLMGDSTIVQTAPLNIRQCIEELARGEVNSLNSLDISPREILNHVGLDPLRKLLERHGIEPQAVIAEAARQLLVGGTQHQRFLEEAPTVMQELSLKSEMTTIRAKESNVKDPGEYAELLQQKIARRQELERLRRGV